MDAIMGVDDCACDEEEYNAARARAMDEFAWQETPGDPGVAWQELPRMQPWVDGWEEKKCVQPRVKNGDELMAQGRWMAEATKFEGNSKSSLTCRDFRVPLPEPHDVHHPYRNLVTYDDQTSYKIPKLNGAVQGLKHDTNESQYVPIDNLPPKRLDDDGKDSRRIYDVSKAISWAGTMSFIDIGRDCYARCEAIRKAASQAPVQQTEPETVPANTAIRSGKKRKLHDSPCHPISGNAVKKARKERAVV